MAESFQAFLFRGNATAIITAQEPGPHMWQSLGQLPYSKCSKQWKSEAVVKS